MKNLYQKINLSLLLLPGLFLARKVLAGTGDGGVSYLQNPLSATSVSALLNKLLELFVQLGIIFVTIGILYSGFAYVTAGGSAEKIKKAHEAFFWTIIGGAIVLGAFAITQVVGDTAQSLFS